MYEDAQTQLSNAQAFSANAVSTNALDMNSASIDFSAGLPLEITLCVTVAAKVSGGTETYQFDVINTTDVALTAGLIVLATYPFTFAQAGSILVAGAIIGLNIPPGSITTRFLGYRFVGANTPTITCTAWVNSPLGIQKDKYYPTKIVVL